MYAIENTAGKSELCNDLLMLDGIQYKQRLGVNKCKKIQRKQNMKKRNFFEVFSLRILLKILRICFTVGFNYKLFKKNPLGIFHFINRELCIEIWI